MWFEHVLGSLDIAETTPTITPSFWRTHHRRSLQGSNLKVGHAMGLQIGRAPEAGGRGGPVQLRDQWNHPLLLVIQALGLFGAALKAGFLIVMCLRLLGGVSHSCAQPIPSGTLLSIP